MHWGNYQLHRPVTHESVPARLGCVSRLTDYLMRSPIAQTIGSIDMAERWAYLCIAVPRPSTGMPIRSLSSRRAMPSARWMRLASVRTALPGGTLPHELTAFVGRLDDIAAITGQLQEGAGLITLTGIGGVGKTRLATYTAAQVQATYTNGARLVTLAQLPEGGEVASTVLAGLGLRERPHTMSVDTLINALRDARVLLVLDNCEHVVQSSAELVDQLLRSCVHVQILATSREN